MPRVHLTTTIAAAAATVALLVGVFSSVSGGHGSDSTAPTTITFWHGWSTEDDRRAMAAAVDRFEREHPQIDVDVVAGTDDNRVKDALRAGSTEHPDVVSTLSTDNLGLFCSFEVFTDLNPFVEGAGLDPALIIPTPLLERTRFEGVQCALPLLAESYGLYYNKDAFEEAGIEAPPKTMSEFNDAAVKLSKTDDDGGYEQLGFMPLFSHYQNTASRYAAQWSPAFFDGAGRSNLATDPGFTEMFRWQKHLVDELGGYRKLERFRSTLGEEWGPDNAFHTGQVAMQLDGEWRTRMLEKADVDFDFAVAPFPVPDDQLDSYGKGPVSGAMIGIPAASGKKDAAWELVRYLATDTDAVVALSNSLHNVPSTISALNSPRLDHDPRFRTFVDIASHPESHATPASIDGDAHLLTLHGLGLAHESGTQRDLRAGLKKADEHIQREIDKTRGELVPRW